MNESDTKSIQKIIAESLPEAHAGELKKFIDDANQLKDDHRVLKMEFKDMEKEYTRLLTLEIKAKNIETKMKDLDKKEATIIRENDEIGLKAKLVELREQHAKERISDMFALTGKVFGSNRMNYNVDFTMPVALPKDQYGNVDHCAVTQETVSGSISKED